ncbi:retrovirus-related Pol polyprotein from transposon 297 [Trichonephila clavipes]|nr:retrovirus-related Pol polyprotein from transposon 297 [Trichonephila clavipes]
MGLYLAIFERQVKFLNIPENTLTTYLIGSLPPDIAQLIAREDEYDVQNYEKKKNPDSTWRDFYFELSSYFEGWIKELKITMFDQLKILIIADQIKRKTPANIKEHFLDIWADLNDPLELAEKLDAYGNLRPGMKSYKTEGRNPRQCNGCGPPGVVKSKCPTCTKANEIETTVNCMTLFNLNSNLHPTSVIVLKTFGEKIAVCAGTGASHTIAGEKMFKCIQEHGVTFTNKRISFMMRDGIRQTIMALSAVVDMYIEGKVIPTEFLVLPDAKGNKILLGLDFLNAAGIFLDVQGGKGHFSGNPRKQYKFFKKTLEDITLSAFELQEDDGKNLSPEQARLINILLDGNEACFQPGREPTPYIEHRIDTGDHVPIATSPYRMNPVKKEVLREQIEELLRQNVIEECESPYDAPVVLVPKPNGKVRLCVDYRKLNLVTKVDAYHLP